ncbi:AAA family ATPase [Streptomyces sp. NPDC001759]
MTIPEIRGPLPRPPEHYAARLEKYVCDTVNFETAMVRGLPESGSINKINQAAIRPGSLGAGLEQQGLPGLLAAQQAVAALRDSISGWTWRDDADRVWAEATIERGVEYGWERPRRVEDIPPLAEYCAAGARSTAPPSSGWPTPLSGIPEPQATIPHPPPSEGVRTVRAEPLCAQDAGITRWLWDSRIPLGEITLLAGREGIGKSKVTASKIADVTRGILAGQFYGTPRNVLVVAPEESTPRTIIPVLSAAGADLGRVHVVRVSDAEGVPDSLTLPKDIEALAAEARRIDAALIVFDPITSVLDPTIHRNTGEHVRPVLERIKQMAEELNCAVLGLAHFGKSNSTDPMTLILGSREFTAVVRAVIAAMRDPEDQENGTCILSQEKSNFGRLDIPSYRYRIVPRTVETPEGSTEVGVVEFLEETDRKVSDILAEGLTVESVGATSDAAEWLDAYLIDHGGEAPRAKIMAAGRGAGHSESAIKRASERLNLRVVQSGFPKTSTWQIPAKGLPVGAQRGRPFRLIPLEPTWIR